MNTEWRLNPLEDLALIVGLFTSLITTILWAFGKRIGRVLLVITGPLLMPFSLWGWFGQPQVNHCTHGKPHPIRSA
jgi:hypothetical protein